MIVKNIDNCFLRHQRLVTHRIGQTTPCIKTFLVDNKPHEPGGVRRYLELYPWATFMAYSTLVALSSALYT